MPRSHFIRVLVSGAILGAAPVGAANASADPIPPPSPIAWTDPPEAVRSSVGAVQDACLHWKQREPGVPSSPVAQRFDKSAEAAVCDVALHRPDYEFSLRLEGGLVAALLIGAFLVGAGFCYVALRSLWQGGSSLAQALWDRRRRRRHDPDREIGAV